jgi:acylphosphatase
MSERITRRLLVSGRVQGVGYRESMRMAAGALSVAGWVRNLRDGRVEAVVCGSAGGVDAIVAWAKHGPPAARVDGVEVEAASGDYAGFECWSTA